MNRNGRARTLRRWLITGILAAGAITLWGPSPAQAATMSDKVARYMERNNLRSKKVFVTQVGNRTIRRVFVPVLVGDGNMAEDFVHTFTASKKGIVLHARPYGNNSYPYHYYVRAAFAKNEVYASAYDDFTDDLPRIPQENSKRALKAVAGSRFVPIRLGTTSTATAKTFLRRFHGTDDYDNDKQTYEDFERDAGRRPGDTSADCMWWLPNMKTSLTKNLLQKMGTKRTRGPQEIPALAIHAAKTEVVEVIGVGVQNRSSFNSMSKSALFGNKPTRGEPQSWIKGNSSFSAPLTD